MRNYQKTESEILQYNQSIKSKIGSDDAIKKYWNFFPTPKYLIDKMLEEYKEKPLPKNILEPSAGKGDIIEYINQKTDNSNNHNIFCYELVPELQLILKQKRCKLLGDNFLNHNPKINFDLIIMNPPFDRGVNHILHAWDILKRGGKIIALLNKHTYYNPYNSYRSKFKTLIDQFGKIENLGQAFNKNAERSAKVDVILVTITKKKDRYYQDIGINLSKYSNYDIRNNKAKYEIKEL
jgi:hypothetical protein